MSASVCPYRSNFDINVISIRKCPEIITALSSATQLIITITKRQGGEREGDGKEEEKDEVEELPAAECKGGNVMIVEEDVFRA